MDEHGEVVVDSVESFATALSDLTGLDGELLDANVREVVRVVLSELGGVRLSREVVRAQFYGWINRKLDSNREAMARLYALAASRGLTFNYPTKQTLNWAINSRNPELLAGTLTDAQDGSDPWHVNLDQLGAIGFEESKRLIAAETRNPTKLRKLPDRQVEADVLNSSAGPLAWAIWPSKDLGRVFGGPGQCEDGTEPLARHRGADGEELATLSLRFVDSAGIADLPFIESRDELDAWIASEYERLRNYGFLALVVSASDSEVAWNLITDSVLFAQFFVQQENDKKYFRWRDIRDETVKHVPDLDLASAKFELDCSGFTYRDQFVLHSPDSAVQRVVLVMQKNERDEFPVQCPACRSADIEGNSYPTLGVKSWECRNPLCPERSVYNRGKRYSQKSILAQAAIEDPRNLIAKESVRRWQRDVLPFMSDGEIVDTLVRHYSCVGDTVRTFGFDSEANEIAATAQRKGQAVKSEIDRTAAAGFWKGPLFARFESSNAGLAQSSELQSLVPPASGWAVIQGDAKSVLRQYAGETFDRAITSPPYFNAREYAQWPNIYSYLHDMQAIAAEVFRVLKPGASFAYNIFDYFDNDMTASFSDMGRRRITLSSWTSVAFKRLGFELAGTIVWDKGAIQGKRGFNGGNFSPFYQSPFNCWEHVLLFRKPQDPVAADGNAPPVDWSGVARIHPVVKMIRGKNVLGHTAPFPVELPRRLMAGLPADSLVLDPFSGSGSTGVAAIESGLRSVLVEQDQTYCELSRVILEEAGLSKRWVEEPLWDDVSAST